MYYDKSERKSLGVMDGKVVFWGRHKLYIRNRGEGVVDMEAQCYPPSKNYDRVNKIYCVK